MKFKTNLDQAIHKNLHLVNDWAGVRTEMHFEMSFSGGFGTHLDEHGLGGREANAGRR